MNSKNTIVKKISLTGFIIGMAISCGPGGATKDVPINGAEVYSNNCTRCHNARPASEFSDREWDVIIPHMRERSHLTGPESKAILKFMQLSNRPEVATAPVTIKAVATKEATKIVKKEVSKNPTAGRKLVQKFQCAGCHKVNGVGGTLGPGLDGAIGRRSKNFVFKKIQNPKFNKPSSAMPKYPLSKKQIQYIVDYITTLR